MSVYKRMGKIMAYHEYTIEGRNAVAEALKSGKPIDKLYVLDGCQRSEEHTSELSHR